MLPIADMDAFGRRETPFYYYDMELLARTLSQAAREAARYGIRMHYAVKANAEEPILRRIAAAGFGAECVSGNEVLHAARCGFAPGGIFFDGVGKTDREIAAALQTGIGAFNVESLPELEVLDALAGAAGQVADVQLRINPDVDAETDRRITTGTDEDKFGIPAQEIGTAIGLLRRCRHVRFTGLQFHIGSQIMAVERVVAAECRRVNAVVAAFEAAGLPVRCIDMGGGLGVDYAEPDLHPVPDFGTWLGTIDACIERRPGQEVHVEPGRSLVAQCGSLIARVVYVKAGRKKNFLILDAGMNDLIRPALYGAYHKVENLTAAYVRGREEKDAVYDVVGPVCESTDVWGEHRVLRTARRGDLVAIRSAGAYGSVLSSSYNLRTPAPAVFSAAP